jgi:hypothetical protein
MFRRPFSFPESTMKPLTVSALALMAALAPAAASAADDSAGRLILEGRLRYESVDQQTAPLDAEALTLRTRFGWQSPTAGDFRLLVEAESVTALVDDYSDPLHPDPAYPGVADTPIIELNRAQVTWTGLPDTEVVAGRQRMVFGNARFVGNSGWRQNEQTFDGLRVTSRAFEPFTLSYAWIGRINRPLGREHPQGVWTGDVHAMLAEAETPAGRVSGYGFLIDLDQAPAQSSATWGARLAGGRAIHGSVSATWEAEYAVQSDYGDNPGSYEVDYRLASLGLKTERWSVAAVYERLEGDGVHAFQTPLASGHGFQGWSDVISATPGFGVRDLYLRGQASARVGLPSPLKLTAEAHEFRDASSSFRIGRELDASVQYPLDSHWSLDARAARFEGDRPGFPDTAKGWLIVEYRY